MVDRFDGLAEVVGEGVGGDDMGACLDLDGSVAAGGQVERLKNPRRVTTWNNFVASQPPSSVPEGARPIPFLMVHVGGPGGLGLRGASAIGGILQDGPHRGPPTPLRSRRVNSST